MMRQAGFSAWHQLASGAVSGSSAVWLAGAVQIRQACACVFSLFTSRVLTLGMGGSRPWQVVLLVAGAQEDSASPVRAAATPRVGRLHVWSTQECLRAAAPTCGSEQQRQSAFSTAPYLARKGLHIQSAPLCAALHDCCGIGSRRGVWGRLSPVSYRLCGRCHRWCLIVRAGVFGARSQADLHMPEAVSRCVATIGVSTNTITCVCVLRCSSAVRLVVLGLAEKLRQHGLAEKLRQHAAARCMLAIPGFVACCWLLFACRGEALSRTHKDAGAASGRAAHISSTSAARWPQAVESASWRIVLTSHQQALGST